MIDYHWTPANQRGFLEALANSGNITSAANAVAMSTQAAYAFCGRAGGAAFRLGWDAAILLARRRVEGELLERALAGQEESYERDPDSGRVTRTRIHNGLSMAMLARLDRMALGRNDVPAETAMARIVAQDFDAYLDLIEAGEGGAAAMLFVAARDGGLYSLAGRTIDASAGEPEDFAIHYQLAEKSAGLDDDEEDAEVDPEQAAAEMSVWYCDQAQGWRTDFPPPRDFYGEEEGEFGDDGYERELSDGEAEVRAARAEAETAPLREAGEVARRAWFGLDPDEEHTLLSQAPCHPRECGGPWPDVSLQNNPCMEPEAQAMDPRLRGDDNEGLGSAAEEAKTEIETKSETLLRPPEDPNIRVIRCKPVQYYGNTGIPLDAARAMGIGRS